MKRCDQTLLAVTLFLFIAMSPASAFYNPAAGRWLNRDPIEERSEPNLYGFVHQNPSSRLDKNGLLEFAGVGPGAAIDAPTLGMYLGLAATLSPAEKIALAGGTGVIFSRMSVAWLLMSCISGKEFSGNEVAYFMDRFSVDAKGDIVNPGNSRSTIGFGHNNSLEFTGIYFNPVVAVPNSLFQASSSYDPATDRRLRCTSTRGRIEIDMEFHLYSGASAGAFPSSDLSAPEIFYPEAGHKPASPTAPSAWNGPTISSDSFSVVFEWDYCRTPPYRNVTASRTFVFNLLERNGRPNEWEQYPNSQWFDL